VMVSPVTFKVRWNPNATGPAPEPAPGELPDDVDPRQMSLFGAGWTACSMKYLAEAGAHSVTFYETTGWGGVMETAGGAPLPEKFRSFPGGVFPVYHVFAGMGAFTKGEVLVSRSSAPLAVDGLVMRQGRALRVILVNFTDQAQTVTIKGMGPYAALKSMDENNVEHAMREPGDFGAQTVKTARSGPEGLEVEIQPFAVMRIDGAV